MYLSDSTPLHKFHLKNELLQGGVKKFNPFLADWRWRVVICNKQSQNNISKVLVKRLLCRKAHAQSKCQHAAKDSNSTNFSFFLLSKQPSTICIQAGRDAHLEGKRCESSPPPPTSNSKTQNSVPQQSMWPSTHCLRAVLQSLLE